MNIARKILFVVGFFIVFYFLNAHSTKNVACAASWTTCPGAGGVPVSDIYPGQTYVDSVGLNFKITGRNIPPNQVFRIDVGAPACSEVRCLKRSDNTLTGPFDGTAAYGNIQTIGCSTGACDDNLSVNAYFSGGSFNGTCKVYAGDGTPDVLLPNGIQSDSIRSRNGTEMSFFFYFDCEAPVTPTPTVVTPTPTIVTPTPTVVTPTPTRGVTPGVPTPTVAAPTPTRGVTPGVPTPTSACVVPGKPVVTVTCIGCNNATPVPTNGALPTPTPTTGVVPTPTPTTGGPTPTPTTPAPTPTPTPLRQG